MINVFLEAAIILTLYAVLWFGYSLVIKRNDIADVAWGLGYVLLCLFLFLTNPGHPIAWLCYVLVSIWGIRLSAHIYKRNRHQTEDFRYKKWRQEWGKSFYVRSFFQVYLLQAFLLLIIISPVILAATHSSSTLTTWTLVGTMLWLAGFIWQSVGDHQLAKFRKRKRDSEEILNTGLWKYSRHPNYFGEVVMWWAIFLIILPFPNSFYFIIGPLAITLLIRYVSGVPMLEKRYENNARYQSYRKEVPALFPKFWS